MVQMGLQCPTFSENREIDYCIRECPTQCLEKTFLKEIKKGMIEGGDPHVHGVTSVTGCLRKTFFRKTKEWFQTIGEALIFMDGRSNHELVADINDWCELPFQKEMGISNMLGYLDFYDPYNFRIVDYKRTTPYGIINAPYESTVRQLQAYYTIFKDVLPIKKLELFYYTRTVSEQFITGLKKPYAMHPEAKLKHMIVQDFHPDGRIFFKTILENNITSQPRTYANNKANQNKDRVGKPYHHVGKTYNPLVAVFEIELKDLTSWLTKRITLLQNSINSNKAPPFEYNIPEDIRMVEAKMWMCKKCAFYLLDCFPEEGKMGE